MLMRTVPIIFPMYIMLMQAKKATTSRPAPNGCLCGLHGVLMSFTMSQHISVPNKYMGIEPMSTIHVFQSPFHPIFSRTPSISPASACTISPTSRKAAYPTPSLEHVFFISLK